MSYGRMEEGAVPGARNNPTGPVHLYSISSMSGHTTRALNRTEREKGLRKLEEEMGGRVEKAREVMAKKFLKFLSS